MPDVPTCVPEDKRRRAFDMKEPFGGCGTYGSRPPFGLPEAACMPFNAPLADDVEFVAPLAIAGDPWACASVVCAGEFCDENLELMLVIHEFRRELVLESGGVLPLASFSVLPRLSNVGRFKGIF